MNMIIFQAFFMTLMVFHKNFLTVFVRRIFNILLKYFTAQ